MIKPVSKPAIAWRCPGCVYDFRPDGGPYTSYQCYDCQEQCEQVEVCDECGEDLPDCSCPCDCQKCGTCDECAVCEPDFGCPDCNPRKSWD